MDRAGVQAKLLAAAGGQVVQVKTGGPFLPPSERVLLCFVAEIPDVIARPRLLVEQAGEAFDAVAVDENHRILLLIIYRQERVDLQGHNARFIPAIYELMIQSSAARSPTLITQAAKNKASKTLLTQLPIFQ